MPVHAITPILGFHHCHYPLPYSQQGLFGPTAYKLQQALVVQRNEGQRSLHEMNVLLRTCFIASY